MTAWMATNLGIIESDAGARMRAHLHWLATFLALPHLDCQGCNCLFHLHHATLSYCTVQATIKAKRNVCCSWQAY